jgi:hypothetical protein
MAEFLQRKAEADKRMAALVAKADKLGADPVGELEEFKAHFLGKLKEMRAVAARETQESEALRKGNAELEVNNTQLEHQVAYLLRDLEAAEGGSSSSTSSAAPAGKQQSKQQQPGQEKAKSKKQLKKEAKKAAKAKGGDKGGKKGGNKGKDEDKEKKLFKAALKEGGKKGQDICGLNEMGGVRFFHLALDNAFGRWDLTEEIMKGFNLPVAEGAEERKGGAGHLGKFLMSAGEKTLVLYCHVPKVAQGDATAREWVDTVLPALGPGAKIIEDKGEFIKVEAPADTDKNLFPLKMRDSAINLGFDFLKKRKLVVDAGSDDDIDYGALAEEAGVEWGAEGEDY